MEPKGNHDLYEHAKDMVREAWLHKGKTLSSEKRKKKHDKKVGFLLQSFFGRSVWTLKDLDDAQLLFIMGKANERIERGAESQ